MDVDILPPGRAVYPTAKSSCFFHSFLNMYILWEKEMYRYRFEVSQCSWATYKTLIFYFKILL